MQRKAKSEDKFRKTALIAGVAGQDGSYLAELLIKKGYKVFGFMRTGDSISNLDELRGNKNLILVKGDICDPKSIGGVLRKAKPDEVYNLAAQSDYMKSFSNPKETLDINYRAVGNLVDIAIKINPKVRIFQAGSSEMFGKAKPPQNEETPFFPVSPYGQAKLKAHEEYVVGYRVKHGVFICSGILFNHESPRRGKNFVTRKITSSLAGIKLGSLDSFELGNLDAKRDWGFAGDYVLAMWKMLQRKKPQDFVISTGESRTVRDFFNEAAKNLGMKIKWHGKGLKEIAMDENGRIILRINEKFYRPADTNYSLGDNVKIKKALGWQPKTSFENMVKMMVKKDLEEAKK